MNKKAAITTAIVFLVLFVVFIMQSVVFYVLYGKMAKSFDDSLKPINQDTTTGLMVSNFLSSKVSGSGDVRGHVPFVVDGVQYDMTYSELIALGAENPDWLPVVYQHLRFRESYFQVANYAHKDKQSGSDNWGVELRWDDEVKFSMGATDWSWTHDAVARNAFPIWDLEGIEGYTRREYLSERALENLHESQGFYEDFLIPLSNGEYVIFRFYWRPGKLVED